MTFDRSQRLLFGALLISLLLHLLILFGWGGRRLEATPPASALAPVRALVAVRPAVPAAPTPVAPPDAGRRTAGGGSARSPLPAIPRPVPKTPAPPVAAAAAVEGEATPTTPSAVPASAPAPALAVPSAPAGGEPAASVSADGLRQYRIDLAVAARRFRVYPALARGRGWEGVAEVSVAVTAGVASPNLRLVRSSGHAVLDEQALQMMGRAVASTPLPDSLRGQSFVVPLPVRFSLEE